MDDCEERLAAVEHGHRAAIADTIVLLTSREWSRGFRVGFVIGAAAVGAAWALFAFLWGSA